MENWWIYQGVGAPHAGILRLPVPPPWRVFDGGPPVAPRDGVDSGVPRRLGDHRRAVTYRPRTPELELINAALYLRRPLLVTGKPGTGKSTLAYAVAHELALGPVLRWPITSRSTIQQGLYDYDAIGRLREASLSAQAVGSDEIDIGHYLTLGPLGTALLPYEQPRVLLIDEIDKSDIDLPNDLLNIFEEGEYTIPELRRMAATQPDVEVRTADGGQVGLRGGQVRCRAFPFIVLTSNGEREFPPAFLRRCLQLDLHEPDPEQLAKIVEAHLGPDAHAASEDLIERFVSRRNSGALATDQLLNAIYLTSAAAVESGMGREQLADVILRHIESDADGA
ncbi:dynein-related subfamily AAA family protein [Saccharopolyspora spinosa]|uniref:Dynein-related subfamily AAA family protein n=1 Tax=Saccharopolyspora spinosa TaxID=60894 RepID=A0A2N3Y6R3_SACSN|nr:dynein-related subfamily AAA family protein [Saccharopolyspora spinosa]